MISGNITNFTFFDEIAFDQIRDLNLANDELCHHHQLHGLAT
jgi:hypothetical protein